MSNAAGSAMCKIADPAAPPVSIPQEVSHATPRSGHHPYESRAR